MDCVDRSFGSGGARSLHHVMTTSDVAKKRPTNIQHSEADAGPWSLQKSVKFGYPQDEALASTFAQTAQTQEDLEKNLEIHHEWQFARNNEPLWARPKGSNMNNDLHLLFVRTEKKRLAVVALDVGQAREKGLEASKLVYNKRLAKNYLCSRVTKLDFTYRKQEASMAVTPQGSDVAEVALCLIKESDTLGSAMWTLLDFVVVQVCQSAPLQKDIVQKTKEDAERKCFVVEMLLEAEEKLREELMQLVQSLKLATFNAAKEAAQRLIHKESSADNRSLLRRISQARSVEALTESVKALNKDGSDGRFHDLKVTARNLSNISQVTWEGREKLQWIFSQIEIDQNITPKVDVKVRNQMTMSNLSVHSMGGITVSGFRVLLSWHGDDGTSDLDMYLSCPECEAVVHHKNRQCCCLDEFSLTLEGPTDPEQLGVQWTDGPLGQPRCIQSITKDGPLDRAAASQELQLRPGDLVELGEKVKLLRSKPCRVEMDDNLGPKNVRSEQNIFVQHSSDKTYTLRVHLFAGDPVEYHVLVQRAGFPDIVYTLPPHSDTDETVEVFTMKNLQLESAWEALELD
eukprot:Skav214099  [mRNA]  locus=scaffold1185:175427:179361:- [translate_table: standard]